MRNLPDPVRQPHFYKSVPAKRFVAWLIDLVLIFAISLVALPFTAFLGLFFWPVMILVAGFVYRVATIAAGSATWGMRFVGVELRAADGTRFDGGLALTHTIGYTISFAIPVLQLISVVMMLISSRGQGLTDNILGTVALNRRAAD